MSSSYPWRDRNGVLSTDGPWRARPSLSKCILERVQTPLTVAELVGSLDANPESIARLLRRHRAKGRVALLEDGRWLFVRPRPKPGAINSPPHVYWPK